MDENRAEDAAMALRVEMENGEAREAESGRGDFGVEGDGGEVGEEREVAMEEDIAESMEENMEKGLEEAMEGIEGEAEKRTWQTTLTFRGL
jgi:hypothetical protein